MQQEKVLFLIQNVFFFCFVFVIFQENLYVKVLDEDIVE
jgi:hypothetical protein